MAEQLFGPWHIAASHVDPIPQLSLEISGAANANGRHLIEDGFEVTVDGDGWWIDVGSVDDSTGEWWPVQNLRRETMFVPLKGLTIVFDTRPKPPASGWWVGPLWLGAALTCTSEDPEISPVPSGNLPDFSIRRGFSGHIA